MNESYITIREEAHIEYVEKKSVFLGHAFPVSHEEDCLLFLEEMKSRYADATHNVYAYSLRENHLLRYSDAGEPQGTAGMPTLEVLRKRGVTDALVVVTRYFGGILLGAGGLVRAYSRAASDAIEAAGVVKMAPHLLCRVECRYNEYERMIALFSECGAVEKECSFSDAVSLSYSVPGETAPLLERRIADLTGGRCRPETVGEIYGETVGG